MQLGAVLKCRLAAELGLGTSFIERLMSLPLYARNDDHPFHGCYDPLLVSMVQIFAVQHCCIVTSCLTGDEARRQLPLARGHPALVLAAVLRQRAASVR